MHVADNYQEKLQRTGVSLQGVRSPACIPFALVILLLSTVLRFWRLTEQSLWYDEGFSIALARLPFQELVAWTVQDVHPPLYYVMLGFWMRICGDSDFAVRAFSVLASLLSIALVYRLSKDLWDRDVGLLSAVFVAISPLFLYYAQETRMYALLTSLGLMSSCLLWRAVRSTVSGQRRSLLWIPYVALALVGAYMHYFFLLLLIFHGVYAILRWSQAGYKLHFVLPGLAVVMAWIAGYSVWIPVLLDRYVNDTGYLAGSMSPERALQLIFTSFSVGPVLQGPIVPKLVLGHLLILLFGMLGLIRGIPLQEDRPKARNLVFFGLYLLIPLACLMLLYYQKARVNPHHVILFAPAFFCLLAIGVVLCERAASRCQSWGRWLYGGVSIGALVFVSAVALYADWHYHFTVAYHRPDFRAAVRFVCGEAGQDESVLLVSGHMFPIFDYYCPGRERYPIPNTRVLRVDQRIGFEVIETLQRAAEGKRDIWVMLWQDYFVDPHSIVGWLISDQAEAPRDEFYFHKIRVHHYRLKPDARFSWVEEVSLGEGAIWANGIVLQEARLNKITFTRGESLQLTLYWRATETISESYDVFTHLIDAHDIVWSQHDGIPVGAKRPTNTWHLGEVVGDRHQIEIRDTMPLGEYRIEVGFYQPGLPGMPRLPLAEDKGDGDRVILGTIYVD